MSSVLGSAVTSEISSEKLAEQIDPREVLKGDLEASGKLEGLFVTPCANISMTYLGRPVTVFQTRHYWSDNGKTFYEIDTTYYHGDFNCRPAESDVLYKTYLRGQASFYGASKVNPNAILAKLEWHSGTFFFEKTPWGEDVVAALNVDCPCNGKWTTNAWRSVNASNCGEITPDQYHLCNIIEGGSDYFSYEWIDEHHYVTSVDCFKSNASCWANPVLHNYEREKIPDSQNTHPESCNYILWGQCRAAIEDAADNCATCYELECDGCLFRELNPEWPDPDGKELDYDRWYQCCPCIHLFAQKYEKSWMQVMC